MIHDTEGGKAVKALEVMAALVIKGADMSAAFNAVKNIETGETSDIIMAAGVAFQYDGLGLWDEVKVVVLPLWE